MSKDCEGPVDAPATLLPATLSDDSLPLARECFLAKAVYAVGGVRDKLFLVAARCLRRNLAGFFRAGEDGEWAVLVDVIVRRLAMAGLWSERMYGLPG